MMQFDTILRSLYKALYYCVLILTGKAWNNIILNVLTVYEPSSVSDVLYYLI